MLPEGWQVHHLEQMTRALGKQCIGVGLELDQEGVALRNLYLFILRRMDSDAGEEAPREGFRGAELAASMICSESPRRRGLSLLPVGWTVTRTE